MSVAVDRLAPDAALVEIDGPLDYDETGALDSVLGDVVAGGAMRIAIDLTHATPLDDAAVGVLFDALRRVQPRGGTVVLVVGDRRLSRTLEIMGLDRVFRVCDTADEARRLVAPAPAPSA
jgi:anti-sigma B factor antagonist